MKCPQCGSDNTSDSRFCKSCAAPLIRTETPPQPERTAILTETMAIVLTELRTGTTFAGRYEVIEELGKGGMGHVYKVYDQKTREKIALKLLKPEVAADRQAIERFGNELRFARKISHRNVCRMYDLGEEAGTHFITMEYVPGEDLKSIIRMMGPMSAGKTVLIARQIAEGLAEAHRTGRRSPRPQAPEHHDRPGGKRPDHGFRDRPLREGQGDDGSGGRGRDAGIHVARSSSRGRKRTRGRTSTPWASFFTR